MRGETFQKVQYDPPAIMHKRIELNQATLHLQGWGGGIVVT